MKKVTLIRSASVTQSLGKEAEIGKRLLEPLKSISIAGGVPLHILEDVAVINAPEVHKKEADLWMCIEGEVTFVTGGALVETMPQKLSDGSTNEDELTGERIEGGEEHILSAGDILFIPAGVPHLHKTQGTARLYIIKIPQI